MSFVRIRALEIIPIGVCKSSTAICSYAPVVVTNVAFTFELSYKMAVQGLPDKKFVIYYLCRNN